MGLEKGWKKINNSKKKAKLQSPYRILCIYLNFFFMKWINLFEQVEKETGAVDHCAEWMYGLQTAPWRTRILTLEPLTRNGMGRFRGLI